MLLCSNGLEMAGALWICASGYLRAHGHAKAGVVTRWEMGSRWTMGSFYRETDEYTVKYLVKLSGGCHPNTEACVSVRP